MRRAGNSIIQILEKIHKSDNNKRKPKQKQDFLNDKGGFMNYMHSYKEILTKGFNDLDDLEKKVNHCLNRVTYELRKGK